MPSSSLASTVDTLRFVVEGFRRLFKAASSLFRRQLLILKSEVVPKFVICTISRNDVFHSLRRSMASLHRFTIFRPVSIAILSSQECFWIDFGMLSSMNNVPRYTRYFRRRVGGRKLCLSAFCQYLRPISVSLGQINNHSVPLRTQLHSTLPVPLMWGNSISHPASGSLSSGVTASLDDMGH